MADQQVHKGFQTSIQDAQEKAHQKFLKNNIKGKHLTALEQRIDQALRQMGHSIETTLKLLCEKAGVSQEERNEYFIDHTEGLRDAINKFKADKEAAASKALEEKANEETEQATTV